ncbi:MAG: hypothetical protein GWP05_01305 [Anaerolineaceae bacterium]|nr:hypothetical protein [Anaerolineaceae bacterium]
MDLLDMLNKFLLSIGDPLLGWLLGLPRDVALFIVAIGTALILTVVRLLATNQDLLGRCKKDKARLKQLMREAKTRGDKEAMARYRTTIGQIGMRRMKAEGKPLLASVVPIAILACWCLARIAYLPLTPEEPVQVNVYFPAGEIGKLVHIVPQEGLEAEDGWIRTIERDVNEEGNEIDSGVARWKLLCKKSDKAYLLQIRHNGKTFEKKLFVDGRRYADPVRLYEDESIICSEVYNVKDRDVKGREYKPFGIVPGIPWLALQPWIVGYLIIVLPFSFLLKPVLRIH